MTANIKKLLLAGVVLVIVVIFFVWRWTFRAADTSVASKKTEVTIESGALIKAYTSNEDSTNTLYLNKIVAVTGTIDAINEKDQEIQVYLKKKDEMAGVMCGFYKTEIDKNAIKTGQVITVKGICTGFLMDVVLTKCSIVK
jgi:hypothetical protein